MPTTPEFPDDTQTMESRDWQKLHDLSSRVLNIHTLDEQLTEILRTVAGFHESSQGMISLFCVKTGGLVPVATAGLSREAQDLLACVSVGDGACGLAFASNRRVIVSDTENDPVYTRYAAFARAEGFRSVFSTPFCDSAGSPIGVLSVYAPQPRVPDARELRLTDICIGQATLLVERDRSERALREEQERSHQILSSVKDGILFMDSEFRVRQINAEGLRLDGRMPSEILGRTHWELWPASESLPVGEAYKRAMRDRVPVSLEQCYPHVDRDMWLDIQAFPSSDGLALIYRDISECKEAEIVLREREEQLRLAIEAADIGLWDVDPIGGTLFWAPRVKAMFGISADRPVSMDDYYAGLHPDDREATSVAFANACDPNARALYDVEYRTVGKEDGYIRWVAAKGRAVFDDMDRCVRVIGTAIDITRRKAGEEALRVSEERLRQSDRKKDEFLAMLAHELRNPLAPISAAADLLALTHAHDERVKKTSGTISRQVQHLTGLVDDLLDVSRVTRGLVVLKRDTLDVKQIIAEALEQARPLFEARRHRFALALPSEPAHVVGDRKRLVQVLTNIVNNAAKYTPEGGSIVLGIKVDATTVRILVEDNGIGMTAQTVEQVFEMFSQAERTADRSQGGLGIGLALVKSLVELHQGVVSAHSDGLGHGSTFCIELPRIVMPAQAFELAKGASSQQSDKRLRLLIVDDNQDAAEMLSLCLEAAGHETIVEHDAESALARACTEAPDVFLLDIGLPGVDGNQMAERLKSNPETSASLRIAITGYGQEHDRQKSARAGFDYHLVKPVDIDALLTILAQAASQLSQSAPI